MAPKFAHQNQLLASLAAADFARLEPHLGRRTLAVRDSIEHANQPIETVVFPTSGMVSLVANQGGSRLEVGIIGRDGMTGTALVLGADSSPQEAFVQVAGDAVFIGADEFRRALAERPTLRDALLPYVHALLLQTAQTALANGRFTIEERLARWLLMTQDRIGDDDIRLTHEFLSLMLGVRRPGITVALQVLEGKHAIRNERGLIIIVDRRRLEGLAGDSYLVAPLTPA